VIHISKFILASGSPRRVSLLNRIGADFNTVVPDVDETVFTGLAPAEQVTQLSRLKALSVAERSPELPVVAADTLVALDLQVLGKPSSEEEAFRMLKDLSGKWHQVYTGITAVNGGRAATGYEVTNVKFLELSDEDIYRYIATGEPMDKAGAYGIQEKGALLVERIEGDFYNIVGLPLVRLSKILKKLGLRLAE
jgi:septum formation protein